MAFPSHASQVENFTAFTLGYRSLSQCYPRENIGWLSAGNQQARDFIGPMINRWYDCDVIRIVNCKDMGPPNNETPYGHLGYHPGNIARFLNDPEIRRWRFQRYIELMYILASEAMRGPTDLAMIYACRQGKHRSVAWGCIEMAILKALGIRGWERAVCYGAQKQTRCQKRQGCNLCDPNAPEVVALCEAAVDEFYEVAMVVDDYFA